MSRGNTPSQRPASHLVLFLFLRDIDLKVYVWRLVPAVTPPAPQPGQLEALLSTLPDTDGHYGELVIIYSHLTQTVTIVSSGSES